MEKAQRIFELWACECRFPADSRISREVCLPAQHPVLLVSDSMFKGMRGFGWPASLGVRLSVNGGARLGALCSVLAQSCRAEKPEVAVLHGGVNDISKAGDAGVEELLRVFASAGKRLQNQCQGVKFVFSGICQTKSGVMNRSVALANTALRDMCKEFGWFFLSNDCITQSDLGDQVHLTFWGSMKLQRRLQRLLRSVLVLRTGVHVDLDI